MKLTPINTAEAIFEPFWDPQLSGLAQWTIADGSQHGLRVYQSWCFANFEWTQRPAAGPALHMTRSFDLDCRDYDHLVISVMAPEASILRLTASTDRGAVSFVSPPAPQLKREYAIDLRGATRLGAITIEIDAAAEGQGAGWFNWIGLQNAALLQRHLAEWNRFDAHWDGYLQPESYEPRFAPTLGILIDSAELDELRAAHDAHRREHGASHFMAAAQEARTRAPEQMIGEFVNFRADTRYNRARDHGKLLLSPAANVPASSAATAPGSSAAIAGLLLRDKELLRLAARYAMAIGMCTHWDDGMICAFPGSTFEHRCFVQSLCAHEVALILDLAGEMFTDLGRDLLLRRLAEEGLGNINFITWKHEYIFGCNQLAWFTPGRMLAYLTLERYWTHVRPYTEIARDDLIENLAGSVLSDGGYVEGPTYFRCVARDGGLSLYYYARARGKALADVIPDSMRRTAPFAEAIVSTDAAADVIPICDARPLVEQETAAVMAALLPDSQWTAIFHKTMTRAEGMPETVFAWQMARAVPPQAPPRQPFVALPEMGVMASVRRLGDHEVKLFIMGNKAGAGHAHEDKGSFVLEFAGDTFAMDPGTCDYAHPLSLTLKTCQRHNMLLPGGLAGRPHPLNPLPFDVKPQGEGDAVRFHATLDAAPGWAGVYRTWRRTWHSPTPDRLDITDDYALASGDGVEFCWSTELPVAIEGRHITITGQRGQVEISAPADCALRVDALPLLEGRVQQRIVISRAAREGTLRVEAHLRPRGG